MQRLQSYLQVVTLINVDMAFDGSCLIESGILLAQLRLLHLVSRGLGLSVELLALIALNFDTSPQAEFIGDKGADVHLFLLAKASVNTARDVLDILKA